MEKRAGAIMSDGDFGGLFDVVYYPLFLTIFAAEIDSGCEKGLFFVLAEKLSFCYVHFINFAKKKKMKEVTATDLKYIPVAVKFSEPIPPDHPYYTNLSGLRGSFKRNILFKELNFDIETGSFDPELFSNIKTFIFLAGMPGSGKTTELLSYKKILDSPEGFFTIWCSIDEELDINDMEYMDIVIFQLEKLIERVKDNKVNIKESLVNSMNEWFNERVKEINKKILAEGGFEVEATIATETPIVKLFSFVTKLKTSLTATKENSEIIRKTFRNRFSDFAEKFNEFLEGVNKKIREKKLGQEVLFIIDGLEKILDAKIRKNIIISEQNRIRQIKAYTVFTLPVELVAERNKLIQYFKVITFPFIKIEDAQGNKIDEAYDKLKTFVFKRISPKLFESEKVVEKVIKYSGGSPREVLRILHYSWIFSGARENIITGKALEQGLQKLANELAAYVTPAYLDKLKEIHNLNKQGKVVPYDNVIQEMLEKLIVMEYNDGTVKKPNPVITLSQIYRENVEQ